MLSVPLSSMRFEFMGDMVILDVRLGVVGPS